MRDVRLILRFARGALQSGQGIYHGKTTRNRRRLHNGEGVPHGGGKDPLLLLCAPLFAREGVRLKGT